MTDRPSQSLLDALEAELRPEHRRLLKTSQQAARRYAADRVREMLDGEPGLSANEVLRRLEIDAEGGS